MKRLPGMWAAAFAALLVCWAPPSPAADLERQVASMMDEFQPVIASLSGSGPFLIAVGSFFDPSTRAREPLSRDVENLLFDEVMKRFAESGRAVIVEWMRAAPLTPEKTPGSSTVRYRLSDAVRQLDRPPGRGFLITGYADAASGAPMLRAELITIHDGTAAERFGPPLGISPPSAAAESKPAVTKPAPATAPDIASEKALPDLIPETKEQPNPILEARTATGAAAAEPSVQGPAPKQEMAPSRKGLDTMAETAALTATVIEGKNFRYEGQVNAQGEKHGHGTLLFHSGDRYEGQWKQDRMHGEGTYAFADGDKYVGQWKDSKMHGRGTYFYASGDKYTGRFANDVKDGSGTYIFKNGDRWEGTYLQDKKHGKAVYVWLNGQTQEELWHMGQKVE